ncbi:glycoside hydrolase [Halobaculum sp. CBA1158]|uniref:WD40/YVTN/BNR-like repeat-containing protein n=1 Tax=Halobaculum sp. CBA1158 TaxID=2904243 RepID=UPI001F21809C|nr:sialidase family protein [Halobaculum sp. CBA1158]UIP00013.1 glycoside hydrolase [Halobaculum sp. CBA1158]
MKLGSGPGNRVYATRGLTVGSVTARGEFEPRGDLPNPRVPFSGKQRVNFGPLNRWRTRRLLSPFTGWYTTTNVWAVADGVLLATVGHHLYRSVDDGRSWSHVRELPFDSGPMGSLPTSVCVADGRVFLAEYTFETEPARVLVSEDDGASWRPYLETRDHRHFHGVFSDPYSDTVWATAGDTDEESAIGRLEDGAFRPVGTGSQRWRAVGLAFLPDAVVWGMDCSYAEEVRLFRLPRDAVGEQAPRPEQIGTADASVYYAETVSVDGEEWVALATAAESGVDDTSPAGSVNTCSRSARVLVAGSDSNYEAWHELCSFDRRRTVNEHVSGLPDASAYVFIESTGRGELLVNPFNTATRHGEVLAFGPDDLSALR